MHRKIVIFLIFAGLLALPLTADVKEDFDSVVDFNITLEEIDRYYEVNGVVPPFTDKLLVVEGAISTLEVLSEEPESFLALVEIVSGEWLGMEDVKMYSCLVLLQGPEFAERIPKRRSRREVPNQINPNSHVLIVGRIIDVAPEWGEHPIAIMEGFYLRTID
jgi:hypothetical protein